MDSNADASSASSASSDTAVAVPNNPPDWWFQNPSQIKCGSCGELGHAVIHCFKAPDGFTTGCACCNSADHATVACDEFPDDIQRQINILVTQRGHMPPLESPELPDWYEILFEAVQEGATDAHLGPLPWSQGFAVRHPNCKTHRVDPKTKDWKAARNSCFGTEITLTVLLYAAVWEERAALRRGRCIVSTLRPSKACKHPGNDFRKHLIVKTVEFMESAIWESEFLSPW